MAALGSFVGSLASSFASKAVFTPVKQLFGLCSHSLLGVTPALQASQMQIRTRYIDKMMIRDVKRRQTVKQYAPEKLRINSLRINNVLPKTLQEVASMEMAQLPRDAHRTRITNRCVITSRPRGKLRRWRLSRIVFRQLADYNKLSGVTRAMW